MSVDIKAASARAARILSAPTGVESPAARDLAAAWLAFTAPQPDLAEAEATARRLANWIPAGEAGTMVQAAGLLEIVEGLLRRVRVAEARTECARTRLRSALQVAASDHGTSHEVARWIEGVLADESAEAAKPATPGGDR